MAGGLPGCAFFSHRCFPPRPQRRLFSEKGIFGDVGAESGTGTFAFGNDSKPFFVNGQNDTPARIRAITEALENSQAAGGYDYIVAVPPETWFRRGSLDPHEPWTLPECQPVIDLGERQHGPDRGERDGRPLSLDMVDRPGIARAS